MHVRDMVCFGYGYVAQALHRRLAADASPLPWRVTGTTREPETIARSRDLPADIIAFPGDEWAPQDGASWLVSVPPDDEGCPVYRAFSDRSGTATWIGYLSTTGVYGDLRCGWAFEETPVAPLSIEARRRRIAEAQWLEKGAQIFRLPGIYGPGRSAFDRLRAGAARRIIRHGQIFSRAHVDDIASVLALSIERPRPGAIYNVADDLPCSPDDVTLHAARLLGIDPPQPVPFEEADLSDKAKRFYMECKRVSNARAKAELGWRPAYPDYRTGLASILQAEAAST